MDEEKLVDRITARRYCPKCHKLYNNLTKKPQVDGVCDDDGEKLIQRQDDTKEVFVDRLAQFDRVKEVVLDVYNGEIIEVNGDQEIEIVSKEIMRDIIVR